LCPPGKYTNKPQQSACKTCAANTHQNEEGQNRCKQLSLGRDQDEESKTDDAAVAKYFGRPFRETFYQHCQDRGSAAWRSDGVSKHTSNCEDKTLSWLGSGLGCSRHGTTYGGFQVPSRMCFLTKGAIMLSFGCGEDISFDVAMAATYDIQVYLFDPTPRAKVHVESVLEAIATRDVPQKSKHNRGDYYVAVDGEEHEISGRVDARDFFEKIVQSTVERSQLHHEPWALGDKDGEMSFVAPKSGVSHFLSASGDASKGAGKIIVPVKSVASIMKLKHIKKIDILKIDIEGYENEVIPGLMELIKTWPKEDWPKVLMFDFDSMLAGHPAEDQAGGRRSVKLVEEMGYSIFSGSPNHPDYTFVLKPK
jgi:FkbM family methyltransferase